MGSYKVILFDLDGTLSNPKEGLRRLRIPLVLLFSCVKG